MVNTMIEEQILAMLSRIEKQQRDIQERVVRLEYLLELNGVTKDKQEYRDAEMRFALEHRLDPEIVDLGRDRDESRRISLDFYQRVWNWIAEHEDDPDLSFTKLSAAFAPSGEIGKENWPALMTVIEYLALTRQWGSALVKLTHDSHPAGLPDLLDHPYEAEEA